MKTTSPPKSIKIYKELSQEEQLEIKKLVKIIGEHIIKAIEKKRKLFSVETTEFTSFAVNSVIEAIKQQSKYKALILIEKSGKNRIYISL